MRLGINDGDDQSQKSLLRHLRMSKRTGTLTFPFLWASFRRKQRLSLFEGLRGGVSVCASPLTENSGAAYGAPPHHP